MQLRGFSYCIICSLQVWTQHLQKLEIFINNSFIKVKRSLSRVTSVTPTVLFQCACAPLRVFIGSLYDDKMNIWS